MEPGREGGTWLAINPITGKLGILLNILTVKSDINPNALGRGNNNHPSLINLTRVNKLIMKRL